MGSHPDYAGRVERLGPENVSRDERLRVIVAGSRTISEYGFVANAIETSGFAIAEIVSGHAGGVDLLGERWAKEHGLIIL